MWLLATGTCEAAHRFGWFVGNVTGLLAAFTIVLLILSAPPYRPEVPRAVRPQVRNRFQWLFILVPYLLAAGCIAGGFCVRPYELGCYITTLSLGILAVIGPLMLLLMFTTAQIVGRAGAR
jgi:hypothetical protein